MQTSGDTKLIKPPHQHPGHSAVATKDISKHQNILSDILGRLQNSKVNGKEFIMVRDQKMRCG